VIVVYALLGFALGALLNALADALPLHRTVTRPAYLSRRGPLRARDAAVHLVSASLFAFLWTQYDARPVRLVLVSISTLVLLLVTVTDIEHKRIPDSVILPAIAFAAITSPLSFGDGWPFALVGGCVGFLFFFTAYAFGNRLWGHGALGQGDVKLGAFVGLIGGFPQILVGLIVGLFAGGVVGALLLLVRRASLRTAIPYGPFIVIGGFYAMVWGADVIRWYAGQF